MSIFFSGPPKIFAFWTWRRSESAFSRYLVILGHSPKARLRRDKRKSKQLTSLLWGGRKSARANVTLVDFLPPPPERFFIFGHQIYANFH